MAKKRRVDQAEVGRQHIDNEVELVNGSRDNKQKKKNNKKRIFGDEEKIEVKETPTVSIAVPGSIIDNAQSLELATRVFAISSPRLSVFVSNFFMLNHSRVEEEK